MKEPTTLTEMFQQFMSDSNAISLCVMKVKVMRSDANTNTKALAKALGLICENFKGNDEKIVEGINRLFLEYTKRTK